MGSERIFPPASPLAPVRYLLIDADGTLFNSMPRYAAIFAQTLSPQGIPEEASALYYLRTAGTDLAEQYHGCLADNGVRGKIDELTEQFFAQVSAQEFPLFPDVPQVLPRLSAYEKFVITGTAQDTISTRCARAAIALYFSGIYGHQAELPTKRSAIEYLASTRPNFSAQTVYVTDGIADIRLAHALGIRCIARIGTHTAKELGKEDPRFLMANFIALEKFLGFLAREATSPAADSSHLPRST